jgi:hypothetical protein
LTADGNKYGDYAEFVGTSQDWMIPCYGDQDFDTDKDYDVDIIRPSGSMVYGDFKEWLEEVE